MSYGRFQKQHIKPNSRRADDEIIQAPHNSAHLFFKNNGRFNHSKKEIEEEKQPLPRPYLPLEEALMMIYGHTYP